MVKELSLCRLAVMGDGGVGKTAMVVQLALDHFVETYDPTIEDSYRKQVTIDHASCILEILDTAGQEEYTPLREQWIQESDGLVLVYSITSRQSFNRIQRFYTQALRIKDDALFPIMIVGNKSDRVTERQVPTLEGHAFATSLGCSFRECSAKNPKHIEDTFYDIVRQIRRRRMAKHQAPQSSPTPERGKRARIKSLMEIFRRAKVTTLVDESATEDGRLGLTRRLIESARANKEKDVRACLAAGAQPNDQPGADGAAIHAASASGHVNIVNLLLRKGAAINAMGPLGISPLQIAAAEGHLSIVRLLLHKGAKIEQSSTLHGTALCAAVTRARVEVVLLLIKEHANVNAVGGTYGHPLQAAAWVGNVPIIEALLDSGADINARGEGNCTALQVACFVGNSEAVRTLLVRGSHINAAGGRYGSAMSAANAGNHFEVVTLLLKYGASFDTIFLPQSPTIDTNIGALGGTSSTNLKISAEISDRWPLSTRVEASLASSPRSQLETFSPTGSASTPSRPQISDLGFSTIKDPEDANVDIVFVHGLQGHPERTWWYSVPLPKKRSFRKSTTDLSSRSMLTNTQQPVFWPYDLLSKHPDLDKARILTWGFNSHLIVDFFGTSDQQNMSQHGLNLMVALQQERKTHPLRPLIFVAHSLGGILVKVALDNSKRAQHQPQYLPIYSSTRGIVFLGTPHKGSNLASWGVLASNLAKVALQGPNERILKALKPNNELLENLHVVFRQMLEDNIFKIHSFYETQPMLGIYGLRDLVVPYDSAQVGHARNEVVHQVNGNHSEICKFSKTTDPGYKAVFGAIEDYIKAATAPEEVPNLI